MPVKHFQNNFTGGEWTSRLDSRADLNKYQNALRYLENFIILPHGGVRARGGFHYAAGVKTHSRKVRLIPFEFNVEQAYVLEFGHQYMRVFMNHGQVLTAADSYTKLLLHMNGADASTTFTDSGVTVHTVTPHGTAQLDTDYKVFGSASGLFNGTDAYLTIPDHADWYFVADPFTIDMRVRFSGITHQGLAGQYVDANNYWSFRINSGVTLVFQIMVGGVETAFYSCTPGFVVNTWYHVALVRSGTSVYILVNGYPQTLTVGTAIGSNEVPNLAASLEVGASINHTYLMHGWIDEFRVSKGIARWTSAFSPPTQEYPLPGETSAVEVTSNYPFTEADLATIKKTQSADTMYLVHPSYAPRKLTRSSHVNWALTVIDFIDGPYRDEQATPTITPSDTTGNITLLASDNLFVAGHIGALWRIKHGSTWGYVKITDVDDATHADATVLSTVGSGASAGHCEGAWSTYRGWPTAVMFHESRLWFARDLTIWGSKKGEGHQENFTPGTADDDPMSFTLNTDRVNLIRWLSSTRKLIVGTAGEEFRVQGDPYISVTNIDVKADTNHGSADISPEKVGGATLYVQRAGRKLRELVYSYDVDAYVSPDLTVLAEHITDPKILELAYQQEPDSLLWAVRSDGVLLSMTYMRSEDVVGWARHITDGEVESIAVIPCPDGSRNELWAAIKRIIGGETKRFIEYLDPNIFVDSGLTYSGAPVTAVSGLNHLEDETVKIVGDGAVYPDQVVTDGAVSLSSPCSEIYVGLAYTPLLETMRPEVQLSNGISRGMPKSWGDLWVGLLETVGCMINDEEIPFRAAGVPLDEAIPPFTGDKKVNQTGWGDGRVRIEQPQPLPITVLAVFGDFELGGA